MTQDRPCEIATCPGHIIDPTLGPGPCGVREGELHRLGCDMERCTQCDGQFLYCDCPESTEQRPRVPFFRLWWLCCERCGTAWPTMFHVADEAWKYYVLDLGDGDKFICVDCFKLIAKLRDGGAMLRRYGPPIMIDDPDYRCVVDIRHALSERRGTQNLRTGGRDRVRLPVLSHESAVRNRGRVDFETPASAITDNAAALKLLFAGNKRVKREIVHDLMRELQETAERAARALHWADRALYGYGSRPRKLRPVPDEECAPQPQAQSSEDPRAEEQQ